MADHELDHAATEALTQLFSDHWTTVLAAVRRRVGSIATAEDIAMTVFVTAADRLAREPTTEISVGWLVTVAKRRVIDHLRQAEVARDRLPTIAASADPTPASVAESSTRRCDVAAAIGCLPIRARKAILLRYWGDLDIGSVAASLGSTPKAAESLLIRSRASLATNRHMDRRVVRT